MPSRPKKIFENKLVDGDSSVFTHEGGQAVLYAWGTFDGCTITFKHSPNGSEQFTETLLTFTAKNEGTPVIMSQATRYKATVSSAGASTDINMTLA